MLAARNDASDLTSSIVEDHSGMRRAGQDDCGPAHVAGDLIAGKYRLLSVLADGGMGTIWKAESETTGRLVAVKVASYPGEADTVELGDRLLFEATAAASLRHSAIVQILDFGIAEEVQPFIVMELLEGESLRETIRRTGGLAATDAVRMLLPVLGALQCAHARGIVHCDVKPENIFLAHTGAATPQPKLIDFGIAKMDSARSHSTVSDSVLGSPAYMSPEQTRGQHLDVRTDLWSFTVVLYEAIAGGRPWNPANGIALRRAIVQDSAASLAGVRGVDATLWRILKRGLEKDRNQRWPTSDELAEALARWLRTRGEEERVTEKPAFAHPAIEDSSASTRTCAATPTLRSPCFSDERTSTAESGAASTGVSFLAWRREPGHWHPSSAAFWLVVAVALLVATTVVGKGSQATPSTPAQLGMITMNLHEPKGQCAPTQLMLAR
jgi:serine/threonine-protein kinase